MWYWDAPDGTDCAEKTWFLTKLATGLGLAGSAYYVVLFQPKTVLEAVKNAGGATLTLAALGAMFSATTCITAQVREKPDDALNYFIGGCTSGLLLGVKNQSYATASVACLAFGGFATLAKVSKKEGWVWIPSEPRL
ncbi:PREDICTED: NADH dehydrogenase [ubiquinone] 1 alpha subcomplex subunit 11 [Nanorana parkeri]|uniref:NADH dehydrogenase [ubiquinone] 1 alpha subcomplex subunit 11 n=1 Tax=Nanorana parkeri TaxID=125878 RepID=UPI0008543D66|nr:PREDICTED: NADH dehydrogenase [ubiquinone] 1 alpha subcomplex subunit 11 [Nanorana parkeri]